MYRTGWDFLISNHKWITTPKESLYRYRELSALYGRKQDKEINISLFFISLYIIMSYGRSWPLPTLESKKVPDGSWCPHCWNIETIVKHGRTSAKTQRFRCLNPKCRKTFACWGKRKWVYTDIMKSNFVLYRQLGSYWWLRATAKACGVSPNSLYRRFNDYHDTSLPHPPHRYNKLFRNINPSGGNGS